MERNLSTSRFLQATKLLLSQIIDFLPDPAFAIDLKGKVIVWNRAMEELTGIRAEDMVGKSDYEYSLPFYNARCPILIDLLLHPGPDMDDKYTLVRRKGDTLYAEAVGLPSKRSLWIKARPIYDKTGQIIGAIESIRDITDRKEIEKAHADALMQLTQFVDFLPDPTFAIDLKGRVIMWNRAIENLTHIPARDMVGKVDYEYALPFYGIRRPMLLDNILDPAKEIGGNYSYLKKVNDVVLAIGDVEIKKRKITLWGKAGPIYDSQGNIIGAIESVRDITEAKQTEEALRQSEARYKDIFFNVSDLLYVHDFNGIFIETNLASKKTTGYTEADLQAMNIKDILPVRHKDQFKDYINRVMENGYDEGLMTIITKTGDERVMEYRNSLIIDHQGRPAGVRGSARDITSRIRASRQLEKERDLTASIVETSPAFYDAINPQGKVLYMNQAMLSALGYSLPEVVDKDYLGLFIPEEDREDFKGAMDRMISSKGSIVHDNRVLTKDGRFLLVQWQGKAVFRDNGELEFVFGIGIDVTDQRLLDEALRESEEKYRKIFENANEGIYRTTPEGRLLSVNPSLARMFGFSSPEEMIKGIKDIGKDLYVNPQDRENIIRLLREQDSVEGFEAEMRRQDKSTFWISISLHTVRDAAGNIVYLEGMNVDITERKLSEEERRTYEARLMRSQKLEAIGTLAGGIAHDFNNILSAIIGYSELAIDELPEDSAVSKNIMEVLKAGGRAKDLVKQILTFSRQMETQRKPVKIHLIMKEALKLLRSSIPSTITITEQIDAASGTVFADSTQIHQVIMNLCTNAYQAMLTTGGELTVTLEQLYLDSGFISKHPPLSEGVHLQITVRDTGCGMDTETLKRIFDPFFTTKEKAKGTGLGLATVHGIVTELGGAILVESSINKGSTFEIYLPVSQQEQEDMDDLHGEPTPGTGEAILLVDDEEAIINFTQGMLNQLGYKVKGLCSSIDALNFFRSAPDEIDLIITDQTMPGITGSQLATEILKIRPGMPIILMTGYSETITQEEAFAQGIKEYLDKPFTKNMLAGAIGRSLRG